MDLVNKFKEELITAMKEKDKVKLSTLRSVKGAMQLEIINKKREENDELLLDCINKQIKLRNDSIKEFEAAGRTDLVESYQKEIDILKEYMPRMLSDDEISDIIDKAISKTGASTVKDLGLVMREITPLVKNRCDMKKVTVLVREKLQ